MFVLIKKMFIVIITSLGNGSNHRKCASSNNQQCTIQTTFINIRGIKVSFHISEKIQKNIICAKKFVFGILLHAAEKMVNI